MSRTSTIRQLGILGQRTKKLTNTAVATVGAATLTGAAVVGGLITRTGSTAAYTDTTPTVTLLLAAMALKPKVGQSWLCDIKNNTAFPETISGGTGCTVSAITVVPPFSSVTYLVTYSAAGAYTMVGISVAPITTNFAEVVITTNVITAAENNTTFYLTLVGGFTSTLPAPFLGGYFRFIVAVAPTTAYIITTNGGANIIYGMFEERAGTAGVAGAAQDTQNFVANQAIIADWADYYSDGTNWYVSGMVNVATGVTFAVT